MPHRIFLFYFSVWTSIFFIFRCIFLFYYRQTLQNESFQDIVLVFLHGLRFDLAIQAQILFPFVFMSFLEPLNRFLIYRNIWKYFPVGIILYSISHLTGDFIYFQNANKHIGYEGFVIWGKGFWTVFSSVFVEDLPIVILGFILIGLCLYFFIQVVKKFQYEKDNSPLLQKILKALVIILFLVILARGGFQSSFIGIGNAIVTKNPLLNQFVLNGIFTTVVDFRVEKFPKFQMMHEVEALSVSRELISSVDTEFVNDIFPIYRKTKPTKGVGKPNIMLVILESWPAKYVLEEFSHKINGQEITPEFNKLRKQGIYFPKFFANGGRTSNGLVSILTGIPDRPGVSLVHTRYALHRFTALGSLLKKAGYKVKFYYGGQLAFENLTPIIKHWGFEDLYDYDSFQASGKFQKGVWGFNDLDVYIQILDDMKNDLSNVPKFTVCLTLSTHHPFQIPDKSFEILDPSEEENKFLNSLHYADYALGKFIDGFKQLPEFEKTIFIFVADHTSHRKLNYYEDRNIPFLIYAPWKFQPSINYRISSQIDILPTILSFIEEEFYFSSLGKNIFIDSSGGQAYIAFGNIYGWGEKEIFFMDTVDSFNGLNFSMFPPYEARKPCKEDPSPCLLPHKKAKAFLNTVEILLKKNLLSP